MATSRLQRRCCRPSGRTRSRPTSPRPLAPVPPEPRRPSPAHHAADIPCSLLSRDWLEMRPSSGFVVGGVGFEAAVEDADEAVAELAEGGLVADAAGAQGLVVAAGAG